jgi:ATP-dependent RNA helicase DHX29
MAKLLTTSFKNPSKEWTSEEESFFLLACRVLGVGASDKDKALA